MIFITGFDIRNCPVLTARLIDAKVITGFNPEIVCVLSAGFCSDNDRWDLIWHAFDKGITPKLVDLGEISPAIDALREENLKIKN